MFKDARVVSEVCIGPDFCCSKIVRITYWYVHLVMMKVYAGFY